MEVAGQWRREWAGTAEYGKVTEGGVTRRVARAMEVLHASAPGARVRVMRAAYHSSSGPGIPASSYMLHSSRRVISSGFNILESPTFPSKPLEISSTPLESSPESNIETENYKVTEPDDIDISEPSKWRGTTGGNSIRMPSEESSSTDNTSIIDLDSRLHKGLNRKYSYDSENSDLNSIKRNSARSSPLLDAPVALSTLKYKSLLNNSNNWNNRRKSYSFEDTCPANDIMVQSNDTLAMESSTDSGICKSTEIVNDYAEDHQNRNDFVGKERRHNIHQDDSMDNWHFKNKPTPYYRGSKIKSFKDHDIVMEDPLENNIALQATGKLTITVPITIEGVDDGKYNKGNTNDDIDRKIKKVEFCKTELHFAAESGRVNIIATDEKPPPSNDFRKRRSAFVPIKDVFEKPITLFGEKNENIKPDEFSVKESETTEYDENTAATKSILKNKIPKPKPYLLGENMAFREVQEGNQTHNRPVSLGVSLINKGLETQRLGHNKEAVYNFENITNKSFADSLRTNKGPSKNISSKIEKQNPEDESLFLNGEPKTKGGSIHGKLNAFQMSPVQKPKTRQLRESDLTFFGIDNYSNTNPYNKTRHTEHQSTQSKSDIYDNTFESVRLIKKISSAQNSEAESDDLPEYQNIPIKTNFAPVPIPRSRINNKKSDEEATVLKPITEHVQYSSNGLHQPRRSRSRKQDELAISTARSRSEPAKNHKRDSFHKNNKQGSPSERTKGNMEDKVRTKVTDGTKNMSYRSKIEDDVPLYANLDDNKEMMSKRQTSVRSAAATPENCETNRVKNERNKTVNKSTDYNSLERRQNSVKKSARVSRTEKLSTPEQSSITRKIKGHEEESQKTSSMNGYISDSYKKKEQKNIPSQQLMKDNKLFTKEHSGRKNKDLKKNHDKNIEKHLDIQTIKEKNNKNEHKSSRSTDRNSDYRIHPKELRLENKDGRERGTNESRKTSRSEYVIKYDDKNGTVSSISKVRAGHSSSRNKYSSKEINKENSKEMKTKSKHLEKPALLQLPDHRIINGRKQDRKWNTKVYVQRSCQLL